MSRPSSTGAAPKHWRRSALRTRRSLDLCGPCPVRAECLELALREEIVLPRTWVHGIRGGTVPWQRLNLIRQRQRAVQREAAGAGRAVSA
ncbi:WhiB family transcriptional regulator [Sphaerisporangium album]|uniref:WhiB family transcriptional regulator n=1 Tax=Sphaerisporangium album TaxID=509200 RepID=UPI0015F01057